MGKLAPRAEGDEAGLGGSGLMWAEDRPLADAEQRLEVLSLDMVRLSHRQVSQGSWGQEWGVFLGPEGRRLRSGRDCGGCERTLTFQGQ